MTMRIPWQVEDLEVVGIEQGPASADDRSVTRDVPVAPEASSVPKNVEEQCSSTGSIAKQFPAPVIEGNPKENDVDHRVPPPERS